MIFYEAFTDELEKIAGRLSGLAATQRGAGWSTMRSEKAKSLLGTRSQKHFERSARQAPVFDPDPQPAPQPAPLPQPPAPAPAVKPAPEQVPNIPNPALKKQLAPQPQAQPETKGKAGPKSFFTRPAARTARVVRRAAGAAAEQAGSMVPHVSVNMMQQWAAERAARKQQTESQMQAGIR